MRPGNESNTIEAAAATFISEYASTEPDPQKLAKAAFFAGAALGLQIAGDMLKESQL